jgi:AraC-like DNA-binding protein
MRGSHGGAERLREDIEGYLQSCYRSGSPPRAEELARTLGVHPVVLRRRVQHALGVTVSQYVKRAQLWFACELLRGSDLAVGEVARRAAFSSRRSFLRAFRRELWQTPAAYRRSPKVSLDSEAARTEVV